MLGLPIRYSPSGPIIGDPDGPAIPGQGFTLRIADAKNTAGTLVLSTSFQEIPATGPVPFVIGLANPKPGLRYHAECLVPLSATLPCVFSLAAGWRVNGGAWAPPVAADVRTQLVTADVPGSDYVLTRSLLTLGSDLSAPVLDSTTLLEVQFYALATPGTGGGTQALASGLLVGRLVETL